jgi:hypothetical protein
MSKASVSNGQIIFDIRRVARLLRHSPSSVEYKRFGRYNVRTLQRRFSSSWSKIISSAGLRYTPRTSRRIPSTEELKRDLIRVAGELDHVPTRAQYQEWGKFDAETVRRRSGKKNWEDAVASLAGFDREEVKRQQQKGGCYRTTREWLDKLLKLSIELGHAPTTCEANEAGINAHQLCKRVGGNWVDVLEAARIDVRTRSLQAVLLSTPTVTLMEDVIRIARRLGRPPKVREYAEHGHYPYTTVRARLGGWRKVKEKVVEGLRPAPINRAMRLPTFAGTSDSMGQTGEAIKEFFIQRRESAQPGQ